MKKVLVFYYIKKYYGMNHLMLNSFDMLINNKSFFSDNNYEIISCVDFLTDKAIKNKIFDEKSNIAMKQEELNEYQNVINNNFFDLLKTTTIYDNSIYIGFHPVGWVNVFSDSNYNLMKSKNIKIIIWQDDPHYFARDANQPLFTQIKYTNSKLEKCDLIIGPSNLYFKNLNIYTNKTYDIPYYLNKALFENCITMDYNKKNTSIMLFGNCAKQYNLRHSFQTLMNSKSKLSQYIRQIPHCTNDRTKPLFFENSGRKLYKQLSEYKAVVAGTYDFPCNYELAKTYEIMACMCICITDRSEFLDKHGFIPNVHYLLPKYNNKNELEDDPKYYLDIMQSDKGKQIAINGYNKIWALFELKNGLNEYTKLLNKYIV